MKRLPAEDGDQSIKDLLQMVWSEEEEDTLISVAPALTLMAASFGPSASSDLFRLVQFFFLLCSMRRRGKKNQYLGARHDRGIISELKWLSAIVIWWLLFAIVLLSPHFSPPPLAFTRFFPSPLSEFPRWRFMLQFENSRARDQVRGILFETNWWTGSASTFV